MTQTPTQCLYCLRGNTPDDPDSMDEFFAIDLERDVNWGDPTYLCKYCCEKVAALAGFVTMDDLQDQMNVNESLKRKLHDALAKLEDRERRLKHIVRGEIAVKKEQRSQAKKKKATA
jgi:hypothetical protein